MTEHRTSSNQWMRSYWWCIIHKITSIKLDFFPTGLILFQYNILWNWWPFVLVALKHNTVIHATRIKANYQYCILYPIKVYAFCIIYAIQIVVSGDSIIMMKRKVDRNKTCNSSFCKSAIEQSDCFPIFNTLHWFFSIVWFHWFLLKALETAPIPVRSATMESSSTAARRP